MDHFKNDLAEKKLNTSFKEMHRLKYQCSGLAVNLCTDSRHTSYSVLDLAFDSIA